MGAVLAGFGRDGGAVVRLSGLWLWLSSTAVLLAAAGSAAGLVAAESIYGRESAALADAAAAQDVVNVLCVAPLLLAFGAWASRGSLRAYLGWLGCLAFTVDNYAIYAFSVQFGPLFLVWVAVLGLSVFALAGGLSALDMAGVKARFGGRAMPVPAWFLIIAGALFALLWLSEIVPDLLAGDPSRSATGWAVMLPVGVLFVATLAILGLLMRRVTATAVPGHGEVR